MFIVAVTGGIGSGKSAVTDRFSSHGVPVIDADRVSRELVEPGQPALKEIARLFGPGVIQSDGTLDRRTLRETVFKDSAARQALEALLHPLIRQRMRDQLTTLTAAYAIYAIPLLVESNSYKEISRILVVDCPISLQISRIMARDNINADQANRIIAAQSTREERLAMADDIVDNSRSLQELNIQIDKLHEKYRLIANNSQSSNQ